jgi:hypothetical protein
MPPNVQGLLQQQMLQQQAPEQGLMGFLRSPEAMALAAGLLSSKGTFAEGLGQGFSNIAQQRAKQDPLKQFLQFQQSQLAGAQIQDLEQKQIEKEKSESLKRKQAERFRNLLSGTQQSDSYMDSPLTFAAAIDDGQQPFYDGRGEGDQTRVSPLASFETPSGFEVPKERESEVLPPVSQPDGLQSLYRNATQSQRLKADIALENGDVASAINALSTKWSKPEEAVDPVTGNTMYIQTSETGNFRRLPGAAPLKLTPQEESAQEDFRGLVKSRDAFQDLVRPLERVEELLDEGVTTGGLFDKKTKYGGMLRDVARTLGMSNNQQVKLTRDLEKTQDPQAKRELLTKYIQNAFTKYFEGIDKKGMGRVTQAEFEEFRKAFADPNMQPEAIREIIGEYRQRLSEYEAKTDRFNKWRQKYGSYSATSPQGMNFDQYWQNFRRQANEAGLFNPYTQGGQ